MSTNTLLPVLRDRLGFSLRRHYVDEFHLEHVTKLPPGSRIVDIGGHKGTKRGIFDIRKYDYHVVCVNVSPDKGADVIADAASLPFPDGTFDAAICSELLEHVPDPRQVVLEAFRVIKPNGWLFICVPFLYHVHADPHDYGRYTDYFWQQTLQQTGFASIRVEAQGRFWSVMVDMAREAAYQLGKQEIPRNKLMRSLLKRTIGFAKRKAIAWDAAVPPPQREVFSKFTTGFGIQAQKPAA